MRPTTLFRWSPLLAAAALAATGAAQVVGNPGTFPPETSAPHTQGVSAPAPSAHPDTQNSAAPAATSQYAASPVLGTPAEPAHVSLTGGKLSIQAKNSSLSDILHQLAKDTGMSIDGLTKDQRIFGVYGPADPREVLSELLDGAGYNVLMLGSTDSGAPRELQLSMRSNTPLPAGQPTTVAQQQDDDQEETPAPMNYPPAGEVTPRAPMVPPNQTPPNGGVKTPQQLLQELQRMRQQQQQQQQQQQPQ